MIWFGLVLCRINHCWLLMPNSLHTYIYIYIYWKYMCLLNTFLDNIFKWSWAFIYLFLLIFKWFQILLYNCHNSILVICLHIVCSIWTIDSFPSNASEWTWRGTPHSPNLQGWNLQDLCKMHIALFSIWTRVSYVLFR